MRNLRIPRSSGPWHSLHARFPISVPGASVLYCVQFQAAYTSSSKAFSNHITRLAPILPILPPIVHIKPVLYQVCPLRKKSANAPGSEPASPVMPGFDFSNYNRNAALHARGVPLPKATSTGTTIVGCIFDNGVVVRFEITAPTCDSITKFPSDSCRHKSYERSDSC